VWLKGRSMWFEVLSWVKSFNPAANHIGDSNAMAGIAGLATSERLAERGSDLSLPFAVVLGGMQHRRHNHRPF